MSYEGTSHQRLRATAWHIVSPGSGTGSDMAGHSWRGRRMHFDPDAQRAEQARQVWVYREIDQLNGMVQELNMDPRREYAVHREAYERTGDPLELMLMLEYVQ